MKKLLIASAGILLTACGAGTDPEDDGLLEWKDTDKAQVRFGLGNVNGNLYKTDDVVISPTLKEATTTARTELGDVRWVTSVTGNGPEGQSRVLYRSLADANTGKDNYGLVFASADGSLDVKFLDDTGSVFNEYSVSPDTYIDYLPESLYSDASYYSTLVAVPSVNDSMLFDIKGNMVVLKASGVVLPVDEPMGTVQGDYDHPYYGIGPDGYYRQVTAGDGARTITKMNEDGVQLWSWPSEFPAGPTYYDRDSHIVLAYSLAGSGCWIEVWEENQSATGFNKLGRIDCVADNLTRRSFHLDGDQIYLVSNYWSEPYTEFKKYSLNGDLLEEWIYTNPDAEDITSQFVNKEGNLVVLYTRTDVLEPRLNTFTFHYTSTALVLDSEFNTLYEYTFPEYRSNNASIKACTSTWFCFNTDDYTGYTGYWLSSFNMIDGEIYLNTKIQNWSSKDQFTTATYGAKMK